MHYPYYFSLKPCVFALLFVLSICSLHAKTLAYDYAIAWAREGEMERALSELQALHREHPRNTQLLYDYITVLGWANKDTEALALQKKVALREAPHYLLQNLAKAARNLKQFSRATALYSLGLKRFPENPQFSVGLALCLYDSNNTSHADLVLQQAQKRFAHNDDILFTIATTYEYHRNYFEALRIYQTLITRPTTRTKSLINLIGVLRKLKMPFRAQHYVDANPALFDDTTRAAIRSDEAAFELRWALKGYYLHSNQTLLNDALNKINRNLLSFNLNRPETLSLKLVQNSIFDKTAVLNAMGRTHAAIALHDTYAAEGLSFPSYALTAVAEAHLDQKNPKRSQKLLHEALRKDPNNFKAKVLLFYAYSDAYDMHDALAFAAKLDAQETPNIWDRQHLYKMTNPRKLETTILHILSLEYAGYMDSAESRLETLVAKAPANGWLRSTLAKLYYYRGWYDKAKQEYTLLLHQNPDSFTAKEGMILSQLMQRDYEKSYQNIEALQKEYPRKTKALQELNKAYEQSRQGSFSVASRFGDTPTQSSVGSSSGYYINSRLYSPRFNTHYRVFLDAQRSYEKLYGTKLQNYRYGAGLNYTSKTFDANILLAYNAKNIRRFAPSIDLQYALNDYLKVGGGYALFSSQSPLRGLVHGTRADRLFATLSYRYSDEQESALSLEQVDFTDGNLRYALGLRHFQHLIDGPYYNLDGYVYAGATQNSKDDALYYNPNNDAYLSFEAKNSWVLYRFYDISIRQTLGLEFGVHWERDYGSKSTGAFSVAQEWRLHENFGFGFGYLRKRSSYDGNLEYKNEFFLNLDGRF